MQAFSNHFIQRTAYQGKQRPQYFYSALPGFDKLLLDDYRTNACMEFAQVLDYNQTLYMQGGMGSVFHARANTMFARAVRAIEALQQGQDRHGTALPIYLHTWDCGFNRTDGIKLSIEQIAGQEKCRVYATANTSTLVSGNNAARQMLACISELQQLSLRHPGVDSFTLLSDSDNQELTAIQRACSDLQQAVVSHSLIVGYAWLPAAVQADMSTGDKQPLLTSLLLSTSPQRLLDKQQPLQFTVVGLPMLLQAPPRAADSELLISQLPPATKIAGDSESEAAGQPIKLVTQSEQLPILAAITLLAQSTVDAEPGSSGALAKIFSFARLQDQQQHSEGCKLIISHAEAIAEVRLQPAADPIHGMQAKPAIIAESEFSGSKVTQSIKRQLLGMLAQVTGYSVAQLTAPEMAGKTLALDSIMAMELASLFQQSFARPLPAATLLDRPSVEQVMLKLTEQLESEESVSCFSPKGGDAQSAKVGPYPANQAQTAIYYQSRIMPGHIGHLLRYPVRVNSGIDAVVLQQALSALALRHPMLSAQFSASTDQVQMLFNAEPDIVLRVHRFKELGPLKVQQWIEQCSTVPMDLSQDQLCQFHLAVNQRAAGDTECVLLLVAHHIIADYVSLEIIWRDLERSYTSLLKGQPAELPEIGFCYADLAEISSWQASSTEAKQQRNYWQSQLQHAPALLKLGNELSDARQSCAGFEFQKALDQSLNSSISRLAEQLKVTDFLIMFSVYGVLLLQHSKSESVSVGVTTDGRSGHPNRDLVGCFVNTVPVTVAVEWLELSLSDLIRQHAGSIRQRISNDRVAFMELVKLAPIDREPFRPLLFQTLFSWLSGSKPAADDALQRQAYQPVAEHLSQVGVTHDLVLAIHDRPGQRICNWSFDAAVYADPDIIQLAQAYESLLVQLLDNPEKPLGSLLSETPLVSTDQQQRERFEM